MAAATPSTRNSESGRLMIASYAAAVAEPCMRPVEFEISAGPYVLRGPIPRPYERRRTGALAWNEKPGRPGETAELREAAGRFHRIGSPRAAFRKPSCTRPGRAAAEPVPRVPVATEKSASFDQIVLTHAVAKVLILPFTSVILDGNRLPGSDAISAA